jgi:acetyl-CoA C-acetyltransferase
VIVAARRTPIGTAGHALAALTVDQLAAPVLAAVAADAGTRCTSVNRAASIDSPLGPPIDDVILGNCLGPGGNVARISALRAGLGVEVPAVTVDRQCGSGLDAILQGGARIAAGQSELVLAGGAESASTAPHRFWPGGADVDPVRYTRAPFAPDGYPDPEMGPAADSLAAMLQISRGAQDAWAARSFERTIESQRAGRFDAELVPVGCLDHDERPRPGFTPERLARLPAAFVPDGTVTAGNSCGISDGAAAVAITTMKPGRPGLRILGGTVRGCDPSLPGLGPTTAITDLLQQHHLSTAEIGILEITEAFAAQVLAAVETVGFDPARVCPQGGAIAMGHPWGASGAILVVRLFHQMLAPNGPRYGLAACAIGGGQGIAMLFERVAGDG